MRYKHFRKVVVALAVVCSAQPACRFVKEAVTWDQSYTVCDERVELGPQWREFRFSSPAICERYGDMIVVELADVAGAPINPPNHDLQYEIEMSDGTVLTGKNSSFRISPGPPSWCLDIHFDGARRTPRDYTKLRLRSEQLVTAKKIRIASWNPPEE